jgi:CheY-like chemotaxis protein
MKISNRPILLIEDDDVDILTIRRALKEINVSNPIVTRENGEQALAYLADPASVRPCIILLDLNMPTTSEEEQDKVSSFALGVAGYMAKPVDYRRFVEMMRSIDLYWTMSEML